MEFKKYQHIERFGTTEVQHIELGNVFVFPKIDGTNSSIWMDEGKLQAGSRKRHLSLDKDNAKFLEWVLKQQNIINYLTKNTTHRIFGEWLVPHSLKTYKKSAWNKFYVFDVAIDKEESEILHESDSTLKYLHYDIYSKELDKFNIEYILPLCTIKNSNYEQLVEQLQTNDYLIDEGEGIGEGIVIKNYDFKNKYNRQTWAKIVTSEFKQKHRKEMGVTEKKGKRIIELEIAKTFVTKSLCEKVRSKIELDNDGFFSKDIPRLLHTVFYDVVREESWAIIKKHKYPVVDFKRLQHFIYAQVKEHMPKLF